MGLDDLKAPFPTDGEFSLGSSRAVGTTRHLTLVGSRIALHSLS